MAFPRARAVAADGGAKIGARSISPLRLAKASVRRKATTLESVKVAVAIADPGAEERLSSNGARDPIDVVCRLVCEDSAAILSFAEELGRLAADLRFAGKLEALLSREDDTIAEED